MNCHDCQKLFSLYLDKEIDRHSMRELESHLASCLQCTSQWQAFQETVMLLRSLPDAKVPADFLTGIHDKLEPASPWVRAKDWMAGFGQKKVAMSSAFAMLVIGFATASLVQLIPVSPQHENSGEVSRQVAPAAQLVAKNSIADTDVRTNYYPGIPLLSEYEEQGTPAAQQFAMVPRKQREKATVVDFVSTGSTHSASYLDAPLSSFSGNHKSHIVRPDIHITIKPATKREQMALIQQIVHSPYWRSHMHNNTLLLSVPAGNFDHLRHICCQTRTSFSPSYAQDSHFLSPKRLLTVAVSLD